MNKTLMGGVTFAQGSVGLALRLEVQSKGVLRLKGFGVCGFLR